MINVRLINTLHGSEGALLVGCVEPAGPINSAPLSGYAPGVVRSKFESADVVAAEL